MTFEKSTPFIFRPFDLLESFSKALLYFVTCSLFFSSSIFAQPAIAWENAIGGTGYDELRCLQPTPDGGFILACTSPSSELTSTDITEPTNGAGDFWIVKLNADGTILWDRRIGGGDFESAQEIQLTSDGGYIIGGFSRSDASGDKSQGNFGPAATSDIWVAKLDAAGTITWERTYGGSGDEELYHIQETADGGFILGGSSASGISGTKTSVNYGEQDFYVLKIDANGNQLWDQSFGGTVRDVIQGLDEGPDGSFYFGGYSESDDNGNKTDPTFSPGRSDYWVVKTDADGNKIWDKAFGGDSWDQIRNLIVTADGNIILGGFSKSGISGNKTTATYGLEDMWVLKLNPDGDVLWQQNYGGILKEECTQVAETNCGELLLGGFSRSPISGNKTANLEGNHDFWIVKTDLSGNKIWDESYGGDGLDVLFDFKRSFDDGFIFGGVSYSDGTGDRSEPSLGPQDVWLVKLEPEPIIMDSTYVTIMSCSPLDTGIVIDELMNIGGCDSIVFETTLLLPSDTTFIFNTSCSPLDTGIVMNDSLNINGCDSLIIIETAYNPSYSFFTTSMSCDPAEIGLDTTWLFTTEGCDSILINEIVLENFTIEYSINDEICFDENDGVIVVDTAYGGAAPFTYALNGGAFSLENTFAQLSAGMHTIQVMDAQGCEVTQVVEIENGQNFQLLFPADIIISLGDSALLSPFSAIAIESFTWSSNDYLNCDTCFQQFVTPLENTSFELSAVSTSGCLSTASINLFVDKSTGWYAPNAFSPNDDGYNDIFKLFFSQNNVELKSFQIFSRWGAKLYEANDIDLLSNWGWNGKSQDKIWEPGIYVFIAEVQFIDGNVEVIKGDLSLFR